MGGRCTGAGVPWVEWVEDAPARTNAGVFNAVLKL